jgi:hypothetical protein
VDDVEIVAVSTSLSSSDESGQLAKGKQSTHGTVRSPSTHGTVRSPSTYSTVRSPSTHGTIRSPSTTRSESSSIASAFKDIISTPRRNKSDECRTRSARKRGTPPSRPPPADNAGQQHDKRLIRSVQIFLRERSTGN